MSRSPEELAALKAAFAIPDEGDFIPDPAAMTEEERNAFAQQVREVAPIDPQAAPQPGRPGRGPARTAPVPGSPPQQYDLSAAGKGPGTILILYIPQDGSVETLASIRI